MNIKDDFILKDINEGYLVGGYIRDFLMGGISYTKDRDIVIKGAENFAKHLAKKLGCLDKLKCITFAQYKTSYGIYQGKYYIDELTNLNMDLYADEKNLMNLAETFRYQVQFRVKDIPLIYDSSSKAYKNRDGKIINSDNINITSK